MKRKNKERKSTGQEEGAREEREGEGEGEGEERKTKQESQKMLRMIRK